MDKLKELKESWIDNPEFHKMVNEAFIEKVNAEPSLKKYRDFIEGTASGFGERSFTWLHKLVVDEMPDQFTMVEIGIYKSAILCLYLILAKMQGKELTRIGIGPLDNSDGHLQLNYEDEIEKVHQGLGLSSDDLIIVKGPSQDFAIIHHVKERIKADVLYIDGHHGYVETLSDLRNYHSILKSGGYLIIDDSCNDMKMPWGFFQGINTVTDALLDFMKESGREYEFIGNVVHNRIYKKK